MKILITCCIWVLCAGVSQTALASGGGGGGGRDESSTFEIDRDYELGRKYFKARQSDGKKLKYCVKSDSGLAKLSRKSVKPFKKGAARVFTDSLYSCADPESKIVDLIGDEQVTAVLYYLNKRYKLHLTSDS